MVLISFSHKKLEDDYQGVFNVNRVCSSCKYDIVDEFHFILKCHGPIYQNFRSKYIKFYYRTRPSVFKIVQLLSTENVKELCYLGNFLLNSYELRENLLKPYILLDFLYYFLCIIIIYNCIISI